MGVWSLVWGQLAGVTASSILVRFVVPWTSADDHPPAPGPSAARVRDAAGHRQHPARHLDQPRLRGDRSIPGRRRPRRVHARLPPARTADPVGLAGGRRGRLPLLLEPAGLTRSAAARLPEDDPLLAVAGGAAGLRSPDHGRTRRRGPLRRPVVRGGAGAAHPGRLHAGRLGGLQRRRRLQGHREVGHPGEARHRRPVHPGPRPHHRRPPRHRRRGVDPCRRLPRRHPPPPAGRPALHRRDVPGDRPPDDPRLPGWPGHGGGRLRTVSATAGIGNLLSLADDCGRPVASPTWPCSPASPVPTCAASSAGSASDASSRWRRLRDGCRWPRNTHPVPPRTGRMRVLYLIDSLGQGRGREPPRRLPRSTSRHWASTRS